MNATNAPLYNPVELIRRKRSGATLAHEELSWFIDAYVRGDIPDYQMSAFLMAVYFRGMTPEETHTFTDIMLHSGETVNLSDIPGRKVDKHSTGGVGDKVSLVLAPMVAACGVPVPMISGRGLGHTGGTLDKLESIPGFRTDLTINEYRATIKETGLVLSGQTETIAPADRKMYALRDVTGTVESVPLIAGSIMSKKLAEGIDALVLDIKTGNGAFMEEYEQALGLAQALVGIGTSFGKETVAFITAMDQPVGMAVGNWLEVVESVECLRGKRVDDLMELTYVLGGAMAWLGGKARSIAEGKELCASAIWSGRAYEKFLEIVKRQGGDITFIENMSRYPLSSQVCEVKSRSGGFVQGFDTQRVGMLATMLGAGRMKVDDEIDPRAGIVLKKKRGDRVEPGETVAVLYTEKKEIVGQVEEEMRKCVKIGKEKAGDRRLIQAIVDRKGVREWEGDDVRQ